MRRRHYTTCVRRRHWTLLGAPSQFPSWMGCIWVRASTPRVDGWLPHSARRIMITLRSGIARAGLALAVMAGALVGLSAGPAAQPAAAADVPSGFQEQIVFSGLTQPTNIEFSPDGRIFVAEKRGTIKVFDDLNDTTPTTFVDL